MNIEIAKLLLNISFDILKHYTCPENCGGHCCKIYDIHLESADATRISRMNKKNKAIVDAAIYDPKFDNVMFATKPCPFLKSDKCSVHKFKPLTCRQYPFSFKYVDGMISFSLETCPLGCEVLIDFTNYLSTIQMGTEYIEFTRKTLLPFYSNIKVPEKFTIVDFHNEEILQKFLHYLNTTSTEHVLYLRENFKNLYLSIE